MSSDKIKFQFLGQWLLSSDTASFILSGFFGQFGIVCSISLLIASQVFVDLGLFEAILCVFIVFGIMVAINMMQEQRVDQVIYEKLNEFVKQHELSKKDQQDPDLEAGLVVPDAWKTPLQSPRKQSIIHSPKGGTAKLSPQIGIDHPEMPLDIASMPNDIRCGANPRTEILNNLATNVNISMPVDGAESSRLAPPESSRLAPPESSRLAPPESIAPIPTIEASALETSTQI